MILELQRALFISPAVLATSLLLSSCAVTEAEWREVAPLPEPRWFHGAGLGSDGNIYAFGGYVLDRKAGGREYGTGAFSLVVYDPEADSWKRGPEVPHFRVRARWLDPHTDIHGNVTRVPRERIGEGRAVPYELPMGGADHRGRIHWFGRVGPVVFDPAEGAWDQPPPPIYYSHENRLEGPAPEYVRVYAATAVGPDGKFYLLGGLGGRTAEGGPQPYDLLTSVDVYDPATNTWSVASPMREGRQLFAAAFGPDGKLYAFGGYGHAGVVEEEPGESLASFDARGAEMERMGRQALASVEAYDPETDTWQRRTPMPVGLEGMRAALSADGRIYVVGGTRSYSNPEPQREVYIYDPGIDSWTEGPRLHTARQGHTLVSTPEGRIYAVGGTNTYFVFHPRMIVGGAPSKRGGPIASVEVLDTAPRR